MARKRKTPPPVGGGPARRSSRILLIAALGAIGLAAALWAWRAAGVVRADGPIVLISIDTLRADRLPAYGYTRTKTPSIDQLAADGLLFENAYAHSPQTLPSHASILSGELPFEHGARDNIGFTIKPGQRFLQHALRERGFATAGFVSSYVLRRQTGIHQGFDVYDDALPAASPLLPLGQVQRPGSDTMRAAADWIDGLSSPKFFLFAHIYEPHRPYTPPQRFASGDPYDGEVEFSDEIVGGLLDHLRARGLYDRAVIVLLSDHGEGLGDHGEDDHGIFLYRETIRIPLIVKLPQSRGAGRRIADPVQHVDLLPTLLDLMGAPPEGSRGRSLRPVLESRGVLAEAAIYSEAMTPRYHFGWSELYALSTERYRLIRAPRDELYDIVLDPGEQASIAADRPQLHATMRRTLDAMVSQTTVEAPAALSDADRQKLAALGYVGTRTGAAFETPGEELPDPKDRIPVLQAYRRATVLAGERRFDEAIQLYRELLRTHPEMTDVWLQLAEAYNRRGLTPEAFEAYRNAIERRPRDPAALTGAAAALLRLRRLDEARAHAELAVDVAPVVAHELLARIAVEAGDASRARQEAARGEAADPTLPLTTFVDGLLLHRAGRYADAIPHLLRARQALAARTEQLADVNFLAADALAHLERYDEAEPLFRAELSIFPGHVRARAGLAILYRMTGRESESDRAVEDLLRHSPTAEGRAVAAQLWTMFGQPSRAAAVKAAPRRDRSTIGP